MYGGRAGVPLNPNGILNPESLRFRTLDERNKESKVLLMVD
jgi:hypothetical protein